MKRCLLNDLIRKQIERATVTVIANEKEDNAGRGFLVQGGYILTAAHCVPWSGDGRMPLGDFFLVKIITADGSRLTGQVVAVEPVSDIAVIGSPDDQTFYKEAVAFDEFAESVQGLPLCGDEFPFGQDFPIYIFTHLGTWLSGKANQWADNAPTLGVETDQGIVGGTSGSAIVNDCGEVVAVVSTFGGVPTREGKSECADTGSNPRPCQSLPVWVWRAIKAAESADGETETKD